MGCRCNRKACNVCEARKHRKRVVSAALSAGRTVPYEMRTLIEDGWSAATVRKVWRSSLLPSNATTEHERE